MLLSRIYFLFPQPSQVRDAVERLLRIDIPRERMHALARSDRDLSGLPPASRWQREDLLARLEHWGWNANLALFFAMLALFAGASIYGFWGWSLFAGVVMLGCVAGGYWFVTRVPRAHLDQCRQALHHGEVLLMVDVPNSRIPGVEAELRRTHPEAEIGAVGWAPPRVLSGL